MQNGVGGPCLIQFHLDQEHPLSTFVKVKQPNKRGLKPQRKCRSTEELAVIVMSFNACHLGQKMPKGDTENDVCFLLGSESKDCRVQSKAITALRNERD